MIKYCFFILGFWLVFSCKNQGSIQHNNKKFSGMVETDSIFTYTLENRNGVKVTIMNYGATVTSILVPDREGRMGDVVLGFDSLQGYLQKDNPYFGCIVGRYANRIAHAKFELEGRVYTLAANNNGNSLHGGLRGFDKVTWKVDSADERQISLSYLSRDGEEGYPGNLQVHVRYSLNEENSLQIVYRATTDKSTPVNLTNHSYFNLSAGRDPVILNHELRLDAARYTPVNEWLIPTGEMAPVKGTAMDFTVPKRIGKDIDSVPGGFDHNWILDKSDEDKPVASLFDPGSGRLLEVFTTEPGIQFYSGNFLDGTLKGKGGTTYVLHGGCCLETQHFPDSPNQPGFPSAILNPGETYNQITYYKFSVK